MSNLFSELQTAKEKQRQEVQQMQPAQKSTREPTRKPTRARDPSRENLREEKAKQPIDLPTADEIEELTFRLRHTLKVKVQAEIPPEWQEALDQIAAKLKVGKLALYRFIIGEFLREVKRKHK